MRDFAALIGLSLIIAGVALVFVPAALVLSGALTLAVVACTSDPEPDTAAAVDADELSPRQRARKQSKFDKTQRRLELAAHNALRSEPVK